MRTDERTYRHYEAIIVAFRILRKLLETTEYQNIKENKEENIERSK
jgi:hypothetical protein